jgi:hypothetical protein
MDGVGDDNYFYIVGGQVDIATNTAAMDRYDPVTDTWTSLTPVPVGGFTFPVCINASKTKIYCGFPVNAGVQTRRTFEYTIATDSWVTLATVPGSVSVDIDQGSLFCVGDDLYQHGGNSNSPHLQFNKFNFLTNVWEDTGINSAIGDPYRMEGIAQIPGKTFLISGDTFGNTTVKDVMSFDGLAVDNTHADIDHPAGIDNMVCGVIGGQVYCLGGADTGADSGHRDPAPFLRYTP